MPKVALSSIVMGMNSRNSRLVGIVNSTVSINLVKSKIRFKRLLAENDIKTPEIYHVVKSFEDIVKIPWSKLEGLNIVVKPDRGSGGRGIVVLRWSSKRKNWILSNGRLFDRRDIEGRVRDILDGQYSRRNIPDRVFFEEMLIAHRLFRHLTPIGLPDIRVVVYNSVPLMAMLRIPTLESGGKANLHSGGVGVGVDIGSGITTHVIHNNQLSTVHPDTGVRLTDIKIPKWGRVLELAVETQRISGLGYAGVDIVIDKHARVRVLEANARPGLAIQIANLSGLNDRVTRVRNLKVRSVHHGIRLAKELFSEREDGRLRLAKKPVIQRTEVIEISHPTKARTIRVRAKVDTGADSTSIGFMVARKIGYGQLLKELKQHHTFDVMSPLKARGLAAKLRKTDFVQSSDDISLRMVKSATGTTIRVFVPIRVKIQKRSVETLASIVNRAHLSHPVIVGSIDLGGFYVDPTT